MDISTAWKWAKDHLSDAGSVASIVSLGLTIWVALTIRSIKAAYLFNARAPELAKQLRHHATGLAEYLNDFKSFEGKIREELATAEVTANSLARKIDWRHRGPVKDLGKAIKRAAKANLSEPGVRTIYIEIVKVNQYVKDLQADLKWER